MGLENYTRLKKLGKGSFGEVFLVQDKRNGCSYVMKEVDLVQFGPKGRKEALKEVAFLNAMHHPFIVGYREFFEQDPSGMGRKMLYIIMEYADGGDLDGRIKQQHGRPFPESLILEWFVQICLAVKHIHDRKIIHRDLKSENIFLMKATSSNTSQSQVKLGDFGISKSMAHTMANAITRIGTPYYLSPEICMNKPYNQKSDLWSLGVVLYEMMSLKHPFDATSMEGLLNKIVKSQPPPLPRQYSIELRTVVDSLLSKQPSKRPTVNSLLKLPFLTPYVQKLLSPAEMQDEFSHTVLHSDASARSHHPSLPQSNHVAGGGHQQPKPNGIKAKQHQLPPPHPPAPVAAIHHIAPSPLPLPQIPPPQQPQQQPIWEQKESNRAVSPAVYVPVSNRPPSSHRPPVSDRSSLPSAHHQRPPPSPHPQQQPQQERYPPSPYAGLSNADKIRVIREKKEAELREIKAQQLELQRRKQQLQHQQQQMPVQVYDEKSNEEAERDRQLRLLEQRKERQLADARGGGANDYNYPPALRHVNGGGRGIPAVNRREDPSVAATPLNGVPYNDRGAASNRAALQHQQMAEAARRAREEEITRMRVNYFKERKQKRETKLASQQQQQQYQQQQPPSSFYPPIRPLAPPPIQPSYQVGRPNGGYHSRPQSSERERGGGPIIARHGPTGLHQQQQNRRPYLQPAGVAAGRLEQPAAAPRWR